MGRTLFSFAVLVSLVGLTYGATAQEKNELSGLIGRTFVSDHAAYGHHHSRRSSHLGSWTELGSQLRQAAHGPGHCWADG